MASRSHANFLGKFISKFLPSCLLFFSQNRIVTYMCLSHTHIHLSFGLKYCSCKSFWIGFKSLCQLATLVAAGKKHLKLRKYMYVNLNFPIYPPPFIPCYPYVCSLLLCFFSVNKIAYTSFFLIPYTLIGIYQYFFFFLWLTSLCVTVYRSIHII